MKIKLLICSVLCLGLFCAASLINGFNDDNSQEPDSNVELGAEVRDGADDEGFIIF